MENYYIVDTHLHYFSSLRAAQGAAVGISMETGFYGAPEQALAIMKSKNISKDVMLCTLPP